MVEKASVTRKRGRPVEFDEDQVVDAAIGAFFANGLEGTTLAALEEATGQDRSTIYNSFGGKRGLYHRATARYLDYAAAGLFGPLADEDSDGLVAVVELFERIGSGLTSVDVSPGCLIVNDMAASSDPAAAQRYRELLEDGLRSALGRAASAGLIDAESIERRTALLATSVIGINLVSRHTGDNDQVRRLVAATVAEVESWRSVV